MTRKRKRHDDQYDDPDPSDGDDWDPIEPRPGENPEETQAMELILSTPELPRLDCLTRRMPLKVDFSSDVNTRFFTGQFDLLLPNSPTTPSPPLTLTMPQIVAKFAGPPLAENRHPKKRHLSAVVRTLFHVLPLRVIVNAWTEGDSNLSKLRMLFRKMSDPAERQKKAKTGFSTGALAGMYDIRDSNQSACAGMITEVIRLLREGAVMSNLRRNIDCWVGFMLGAVICNRPFDPSQDAGSGSPFLRREEREHLLSLDIGGAQNLQEAIAAHFERKSTPDSPIQIREIITQFPRFLFINLVRRSVDETPAVTRVDSPLFQFPARLDMGPYGPPRCPRPYDLAAVIADPKFNDSPRSYEAFIRIYNQWMRFEDRTIRAIEVEPGLEQTAQDTLPKMVSGQAGPEILLYVAMN
jgi:hypothetical protein